MSITKKTEHAFNHTDTLKVAIEIDDYSANFLHATVTYFYEDNQWTWGFETAKDVRKEKMINQLVEMISGNLKRQIKETL